MSYLTMEKIIHFLVQIGVKLCNFIALNFALFCVTEVSYSSATFVVAA